MTPDEKDKALRNDPILKKWENNFFKNQQNNAFSRGTTRPLNFLINNPPYSKVPVILVAAGPSLDRNINSLKNAKEKCIIICAEVILFKLLDNGITPDYVVTIDPSDQFKGFIEGYNTETITYVCPTTVHPSIIDIWKGKIIFFNQYDTPGSYKEKTLKKIEMQGWKGFENKFFVGATMMQFAQLMDPSIIGIVGFDFAYTDDKPYCDGFIDKRVSYYVGPKGSPEWEEGFKSLNEIPKDFYVTVSGKNIYTTQLLLLYKYVFLQLVGNFHKQVINCTEGGILTEIKEQPLQTFIDTNCTTQIVKKSEFIIQKRKRHRK